MFEEKPTAPEACQTAVGFILHVYLISGRIKQASDSHYTVVIYYLDRYSSTFSAVTET